MFQTAISRYGAARRTGALAALALAGALAHAAPAFAAEYPSQLVVRDRPANAGHPAEVEVELVIGATAAATAKVTIYVPAGLGVDTSQAAGARIGDAVVTSRSGDALLQRRGSILVDDPADYLGQTCAPGAHAAVWVLKVSAGATERQIPVFVDRTGPDISRTAAYTLQACFANPATGGFSLNGLDLDLTTAITNASATGMHVWRALVTPFGADGTPNLGGTKEVQAFAPFPQRIALAARYVRKSRTVVLSGTVTAAGVPRPGQKVHFVASRTASFSRGKPLGTARTDGAGRFELIRKLRATTYVAAYINFYRTSRCAAAIGPAPCVGATVTPPPNAYVRAVVRR